MAEYAELTTEQLKAYNIVIGVDLSGSMTAPHKHTTRIGHVKETIGALARWAGEYDADGLTIITFASDALIFDGVTADKVDDVLSARPNGSTNLTAGLKELGKFHASTDKPTVALFFTDGQPDDKETAAQELISIANSLEKDEDFAISFIQVGDDAEAAKFLASLDDDLQAKGAKFDVVDTITQAEAETLTLPQIIAKALND